MQVEIEVRRENRREVPSDWYKHVGRIQGVTVLSANYHRVTATLTPDALATINKLLGNYCYVQTIVDSLPN